MLSELPQQKMNLLINLICIVCDQSLSLLDLYNLRRLCVLGDRLSSLDWSSIFENGICNTFQTIKNNVSIRPS